MTGLEEGFGIGGGELVGVLVRLEVGFRKEELGVLLLGVGVYLVLLGEC